MQEQILGPLCARCIAPMVFHSVQDVHTSDGHELLQVFECEQCNRLTAFSVLKTVAGT